MRIVDFYPAQGSFSPGGTVTFCIEVATSIPQDIEARILIQHHAEAPTRMEQTFRLTGGAQTLQMDWMPPAEARGYSVCLEVFPFRASPALLASTAFDVLAHWTHFPRYGFLTDFSASRPDPEAVLKKLARFHINGLQFYDWQYRHDQLLAPTEDYIDPLGREMSLVTVRRLVDAAHRYGMAAMPYLAIYAASADFWRAHRDWALYDDARNPIPFGENFLGLMDPSPGSPWSKHLLGECARALESIPFDGLHVDQYGEPRRAWDVRHNPVDLPRAFLDFVRLASSQHPNKTVVFNAVGNWPIETLAESAVGFLYIEVWPPDVEYCHLAEIVLSAVRRSGGKAVVIALYLPTSRPANNLLADSAIWACGGTRIALGEDARLLTDPYFPSSEEISPDLGSELRRFSDFMVRNGEWVRPYTLSEAERELWSQAELNPEFVSTDRDIWVVARRSSHSLVLQLINFKGIDPHQRWDEAHVPPVPSRNVSMRVELSHRPAQMFWDCPEKTNGLQPLSFDYSDESLTFQLPPIHFIGLVVIYE